MVSLAYPGTCASADDILVAGGWYDQAIVTDHHLDLSWLVSGRESHQGTLSALLSAARATDLSKPEFELASAFSPMVDEAEYRMQVNQILEHIYAGDCYQVNFAQPFSATFRGHAAAAYQRLRRAAGGPWSGFMRYQGGCILSCSPESLLEVNQQQVCSSPIKGTVRRAVDTREDQLLKASLAGSHKDKAENLMIVDLIRNDLGKVAEPGSINVTELFGLYSFANVHHLVSRIEARLKAQASAVDALTALWPGGSVTGAPKAMSMGIIDRLEAIPRGFYCGSMGYISNNGRAAFNIMIRTMTTQQQSISCWGGGGIVADSCPRKEYQESLTKIDRLIQALSCN
jgi:para-aminobenzoate synthetase component 1